LIPNDDDLGDNKDTWTVEIYVTRAPSADEGSAGSGGAGTDPVISTVDELRRFMNEFRSTSQPPDSGGGNNNVPALGAAPQNELEKLLSDLDKILSEKYAFDIFAPNSINFGIMVNYRQEWTPLNYQVGNLVSTIPLAPQEVRRYTTKTVVKKTRNVKEIDDSLHTRKEESTQTSRADAESVEKALTNTNFQITASERC